MELRTLEEEVEMDHIRKILAVVTEVVGIREGDKIIVMIVTVVAMVTETTTVEGVVLITMTTVDHRNIVTMV